MSKGVLLFAQNNAEIDYIQLAISAAQRIHKFLNVPVTLITDNRDYLVKTYPDKVDVFDSIIDIKTNLSQKRHFHDGSITVNVLAWNNFTRADAFDIRPYDETLIIDVDYLINSQVLNAVWGSDDDMSIYKSSYDLAQWRDVSSFQYINQYSIPFYWATVFYFKKTAASQSFFKIIQHVRQNWSYYRMLYSIESKTFRNDFAFSIAIHLLNNNSAGNTVSNLPGKLYYTVDKDLLVGVKDTTLTFLLEKEKYHGEYTLLQTNKLDVHVMNKYSLARNINE
jgi:hypothetical protein